MALRIFGPKRDEVICGCNNIAEWGAYDLNCLPSKMTVIKSRMMGWTGHVA
jgi:hypothetical protein